MRQIEIGISPAKVAAFRYAPVTTVDTGRSFSIHKELLSHRRRRITNKNMEMTKVIPLFVCLNKQTVELPWK